MILARLVIAGATESKPRASGDDPVFPGGRIAADE